MYSNNTKKDRITPCCFLCLPFARVPDVVVKEVHVGVTSRRRRPWLYFLSVSHTTHAWRPGLCISNKTKKYNLTILQYTRWCHIYTETPQCNLVRYRVNCNMCYNRPRRYSSYLVGHKLIFYCHTFGCTRSSRFSFCTRYENSRGTSGAENLRMSSVFVEVIAPMRCLNDSMFVSVPLSPLPPLPYPPM